MVSNFIMQALEGRSLTVYGSGQQSRSFCFVSDMVNGLIALMNGPCIHVWVQDVLLGAADVQGPINLGNPTELTIAEIADEIRRRIAPDLPIVYGP